MATLPPIEIDATGNLDPRDLTVTGGDQVSWQATDPNALEWYICFLTPFKEQVIATNKNTGATKTLEVRQSAGYCTYTVTDVDPRLRKKRKGLPRKKERGFHSGGGIIIDN
ncbi:MAG TPA: hypothetical protein VGR73_02145 [Bryobacteraceae bacterium]|nr:hypothetical protein [Bryobacteraceae bacterium]